MNSVIALQEHGHSVWLDFLARGFVAKGELKKLIDEVGPRGVTSNPSIFEKAIDSSDEYDDEIQNRLQQNDCRVGDLYEKLVVEDIRHAADVVRPVYDATGSVDGYVSVEVSPYLAMETDATVAEAKRLWGEIDRKNVMIKVTATDARLSEAFAARGGDIGHVASVASFFVSRIDSAVDKLLDEKNTKANDPDEKVRLAALKGKVAIANAKLAYQRYLRLFAAERWKQLAAKGAKPQRLLWTSTGTKNKACRDVMYVEELIGPNTVNTMPPATLEAFREHGQVCDTLQANIDQAQRVLEELERAGISLDDVTSKPTEEGVRLFADAADKLLGALAKKRASVLGDRLDRQTFALREDFKAALQGLAEHWRARGAIRRLWQHDKSIWTGADEDRWLGWLDSVGEAYRSITEYQDFADDMRRAAIDEAVPVEVLSAALFARFRSRREHTFAEKILSAMRKGFGGHIEPKAPHP
jgi:transaldolase / glucose-6-phosphate isomerase